MKKILVLCLLLAGAWPLWSQRTLVAPVNPPRIFPAKVGGDRDFWGHGPQVTGDVRIAVTEGRSQIIAFINLRLVETEGDASAAEINETRLIYSAPPGKQIKTVNFPTDMNSHFDMKLPKGGINIVRPTTNAGPVNYLRVNGDTGGLDIGNNTDDDCHVSVLFRGFVVELEPLAAGVREITLAKSLLAATVATQLRGTTGKLNTFGPRVGDSWFKAGDSWMKFPNAIRPDTMYFDQLREILISPRRYYYNDIRLRNISGQANKQYIRMNVSWEGDGPELRGECVNDVGCMFGTPTVQIDNLNIQINVRPFVAGGTITYDPHDIQVEFSYVFNADCGILADLCKEIFKDPMQNAFFQTRFMLANVMGSDAVRNQISAALNNGVLNFIRTLGRFPEASQIVDVIDNGTTLMIRCR